MLRVSLKSFLGKKFQINCTKILIATRYTYNGKLLNKYCNLSLKSNFQNILLNRKKELKIMLEMK